MIEITALDSRQIEYRILDKILVSYYK